MPGRSTADGMRADAARAIAESLAAVGIGVEMEHPLTLMLPDRRAIALELRTRAVVDGAAASRFAAAPGRPLIVVADLITAEARAVLETAGIGWLDRRGHLRLVAPGLFVDKDVRPQGRVTRPGAKPGIRGAASMGVAAAHLIGEAGGVRQLASRVGLSPAAISKARIALAGAGLLDDGPDARRALFWLLADAWHPGWVELARMPAARDSLAASGFRAASALGAPIILTADYAIELYAPDRSTFERVRLLTSDAARGGTDRGLAARLAVAPTPLVAATRTRAAARLGDWAVTHPLFVGLDLATDLSRGQEALEAWEPAGWDRAW